MPYGIRTAEEIEAARVAALDIATPSITHDTLRNMLRPPVMIRPSAISFATSLCQSFTRYGRWTDRQFVAARNLINEANVSAQRAVAAAQQSPEAAANSAISTGTVDTNDHSRVTAEIVSRLAPGVTQPGAVTPNGGLDRIHAMFATARASGLMRPRVTLSVDGRALTLTPQRADPDAINVRQGSLWLGTIRNGTVFGGARGGPVGAALDALAADPDAALTAYGRMTGRCSCCSRPLSDPISVTMGIGPICAARFGLSRAGVVPAALVAVSPANPAAPSITGVPRTPPRPRVIAAPSQVRRPVSVGHVYADDEVLR